MENRNDAGGGRSECLNKRFHTKNRGENKDNMLERR
jgi:hypothetical protein